MNKLLNIKKCTLPKFAPHLIYFARNAFSFKRQQLSAAARRLGKTTSRTVAKILLSYQDSLYWTEDLGMISLLNVFFLVSHNITLFCYQNIVSVTTILLSLTWNGRKSGKNTYFTQRWRKVSGFVSYRHLFRPAINRSVVGSELKIKSEEKVITRPEMVLFKLLN